MADADGRDARPLASSPAHDYNASFSRDGQWITFTSDRSGSADIYRVRRDGTGLERLTTNLAFDDQASLSPDGTLLAFVSTRNGRANVWILGMRTRRARNLTGGGHARGDFRPAWSPDGRWIAFSSQRDSRKPNATRVPDIDIYIIHPDGSGLRRLTSDQGFAGSPSRSRDSSRLVFYQGSIDEVMKIRDARELRGTTQIVSVDTVTGEQRVLTTGEGARMDGTGSARSVLFDDPERNALAPAFSPDGRTIAFGIGTFFQATFGQAMPAAPRRADIATINSDGTGFSLVTNGDGNYGFPSWSPDGRRFVVRALTATGKGLAIVDARSGDRTWLTTGPNDTVPAWSPRGDVIAFSSDRDSGNFDIYSIRIDGTGLRRLTNMAGNDAHCAWSPDGHWLVFSSARGGYKDEAALHPRNPQPYGDLYVMRSDGSDVRQLTDDQYEDGTVTFVPTRRTKSTESSGRIR